MAVDRDYLQAQIAALRDLADEAERAGDTAGAATYLRLRAQQMDRLRELEERLAGDKGLPAAKRSAKVDPVADAMTGEHREAISRGHGDSAPMKAARKVGIRSMAQLAKKLGVSPGFLSQVVHGVRPMPTDRAEAFEKLTGVRWKV